MKNNPFLDFSALPRFNEMCPEHASPAVQSVLSDLDIVVCQAATAEPTWDIMWKPLSDAIKSVDRVGALIEHMHQVVDDDRWREAHCVNSQKITASLTKLMQDEKIYANLQTLADDSGLPATRRAIIKKKICEFKLAGAGLSAEKKKELCANSEQLVMLKDRFLENMRNAGKTDVANKCDNIALIDEILKLRKRQAELLGFDDYAELALQSHMAASPAHVMKFLKDLTAKVRPVAEQEFTELDKPAARELSLITYLPPYLVTCRIRQGLFDYIKKLFGISLVPKNAPKWVPETEYFDVRDADGKTIGGLYLDLYNRDEKHKGQWTIGIISRRRDLQLPVAIVVCDFARHDGPANEAPMDWKEALALFHEFGHALHHILTDVDDSAASGMIDVEQDAVEMPSKFMENFLWDWDALSPMTSHVENGKPMPRDLFDFAVAGKRFVILLQYLERALFDMKLHTGEPRPFMDILEEVHQDLATMGCSEWSCINFDHIFGIDFCKYAARCYTYLWGESLSADAFAMFKKSGETINPALGARFRREIFAVGGSRPFMESFSALLGRDHDPNALLRCYGISPEASKRNSSPKTH